ncbi:hypothetical protein [Pseudalkalibacillus caeni]|nr:hypothetical protein [Pseudalkalibacillus caeni]
MLVIGWSVTVIAVNSHSHPWMELGMLVVGVILNIWSMIGIILHFRLKKQNKI